jgi:hypothetical protein
MWGHGHSPTLFFVRSGEDDEDSIDEFDNGNGGFNFGWEMGRVTISARV